MVHNNDRWIALECVGSAQVDPFHIMIFGGWKFNRTETRKCFMFDINTNEICLMRDVKLNAKSGFYYALRPYNDYKKIHMMDPSFNIISFDIQRKKWSIVKKEEWKEDDGKGSEGCKII